MNIGENSTCSRMAQKIWDVYRTSHLQQLAYHSIITELLKGELEWVHCVDKKTTVVTEWEGRPLPIKALWAQFIQEFILHLHLFGYVAYRLQRKGKTVWYEIADPTMYEIRREPTTSLWSIHVTTTFLENPLKGTKQWHLAMFSMPLYSHDRLQIHYTSCGYQAMEFALELQRIREETQQRDKYNAMPTVFTQVSRQIVSSTEGKRPWFRTAALPMYENAMAPDVPQDFNTMVEERAETIQRLDELSEQARQRTQQIYDPDTEPYAVGMGSRPKRKRQLRELMISDGREGSTAPFLRSPEGLDKIIQKHEQHILFAWGVPPQVLGQNINTERTAASNRLSDIAISGFEANIKIIRQHLQEALCTLTTQISRDPTVYLRLASCMSTYNLSQLEGILTPEACLATYSCVYQVPVEHLSLDAIKARQATLNNTAASKERLEQKATTAMGETGASAQGTSKNRPTMTEQQKDQRAIAKSKQPSA